MVAKNISAIDQSAFAADPNADLGDRFPTEFVGQKLDLGFVAVRGAADDVDKIIQIGQRDEIAFQCLGPGLGLTEKKTGAPENHIPAMFDVTKQRFLERQQFGSAVI